MLPPSASAAAISDAATAPAVEHLEPFPEQLYDLFGVAIHHGTMQNGHYTSFVRRQSEWFHCDDALVTPAPSDTAPSVPPTIEMADAPAALEEAGGGMVEGGQA